jgi:hypothetical protein
MADKHYYQLLFSDLFDLIDFRLQSGIPWKQVDENMLTVLVLINETEADQIKNKFPVVAISKIEEHP